ncbi:MAG: Na+/H+ antiporter subunit E [Candidatus Omnitrophota bacterium]
MRSRIALFVLAYAIWALLCWAPTWQDLLAGLVIALFVAYLTGDLFPSRFGLLLDFKRYMWALYFIPVFLWECIKANVDVAYRVAHPDLPINPGIVKIRTGLKSEAALTFLANSITLTPGTMCVDIDKEKGVLYIHWINVKSKDVEEATRLIAGRFERILKEIFE